MPHSNNFLFEIIFYGHTVNMEIIFYGHTVERESIFAHKVEYLNGKVKDS